jgi:hypothetical protein
MMMPARSSTTEDVQKQKFNNRRCSEAEVQRQKMFRTSSRHVHIYIYIINVCVSVCVYLAVFRILQKGATARETTVVNSLEECKNQMQVHVVVIERVLVGEEKVVFAFGQQKFGLGLRLGLRT